MWEAIAELVAGGTTVLLTTQYIEEADRLADRIVVIDAGRVIAAGTAAELRAAVGGERIDVVLRADSDLAPVAASLARALGTVAQVEPASRRVTASAPEGASALVAAVRALDAAGIAVEDIALRRPTLDDVFLRLTGHGASAGSEDAPQGAGLGREAVS